MRNDRSSIQRCLFKIHERFYCDLPYRSPSQKGEQGHIERRERERDQERKDVWPTFATIHQRRIARKQERERGIEREGTRGRTRTPRNILIVEFSMRAAYPLELLCPLPGTDLLIINYSDHQVHPSPLSRGCYSVTFAAAFRTHNLFYCGCSFNKKKKQKKTCNKYTTSVGTR